MRFTSACLASLALGLATAAPTAPRSTTTTPKNPVPATKLVTAGGDVINIVSFDGAKLEVLANATIDGTLQTWVAIKNNQVIYGLDELSNKTRVFAFDPKANTINLIQEIESRAGAAHLAFSTDGQILAAANFGNGSTSYFDATGKDGRLTHLVDIDYNQFPPGGLAARQMQSNPHQHVPEGTGQFMLVNDLGEDRIHVIDVRNMSNIHLASSIKVGNATGPRHGVFYPPSAVVATQYIVANELSSTISVFNVTYLADTLELTLVQEIPTFDPKNPPPLPPNGFQSTAGELIMNPNGLEVYVTNRLTGAPNDNFATFSVNPDGTVNFIRQDSSGGPVPRHISLGGVGGRSQAFISNQNGNLAVLNVDEVTGLPNSGIITEIALKGPAYAMDITTVPIAGVVNR